MTQLYYKGKLVFLHEILTWDQYFNLKCHKPNEYIIVWADDVQCRIQRKYLMWGGCDGKEA